MARDHQDKKAPYSNRRGSDAQPQQHADHCTRAEGQRADEMMRRLEAAGIPATRSNSANFNTDGMAPEGMQNLNSVMAGALPAVFVNGTGKANPSFEEVAAQYKRTKM